MSSSGRHLAALLFIAAALCLAAGCDLTGEYEAKFKETLVSSGQRAVFDKTLFPNETEVTDPGRKPTGVKLRIPALFDTNSKSLPPTEARSNPPSGRLPGMSYAIERQIDDDKGQFLPAYIYFAAVAKADQKADALQAALAGAVPGASWSDVPLKTPEGSSVTFKRLQVSGPQEFTNLQTKQPVRVEGRFDLYLVDAPAYNVLIGWRTPKTQGDKYQFSTAVEAAMGTVTVDQAAQPPAAAPAAGAKAG